MKKRKRLNAKDVRLLWNYLSKSDLRKTFAVSERTVREWRIILDLPKKPCGKKDITDFKDKKFVYISNAKENPIKEKYFLFCFDTDKELNDFISLENKPYQTYTNKDKVIPYVRFKGDA